MSETGCEKVEQPSMLNCEMNRMTDTVCRVKEQLDSLAQKLYPVLVDAAPQEKLDALSKDEVPPFELGRRCRETCDAIDSISETIGDLLRRCQL